MGVEKKLTDLLQEHVKPFVNKIDSNCYYAKAYLQALGEAGYFRSAGINKQEVLLRGFQVVHETSKVCMTTGFVVWCHLAFLTYIRNCTNEALKKEMLSQFESGEMIGATGLSNPMKSYAGLETLHLQARQVEGGFRLSGTLPAVSNLADSHWVAVLASQDNGQKIIAILPIEREGLSLKEKCDFLGVNGSATYTCQFKDVFIPSERLLTTDADSFIGEILSTFVFFQIPIGLGVTEAALSSIQKARDYQFGGNQYLPVQARTFSQEYRALYHRAVSFSDDFSQVNWEELLSTRLDVAQLVLQATQAEMIHQGSAGYLQKSPSSRRLRESFFYANLTPTVRHLNKLLCEWVS